MIKHLKYNNKKVEYEGIKFDSSRERDRYIFLKEKEREGVILDLKLQPIFELIPNQYKKSQKVLKTKIKEIEILVERSLSYRADFSYILAKTREYIVEDVKISKKLRPVEFRIKKKLMYWFHKIEVREVYKSNEEIKS